MMSFPQEFVIQKKKKTKDTVAIPPQLPFAETDDPRPFFVFCEKFLIRLTHFECLRHCTG